MASLFVYNILLNYSEAGAPERISSFAYDSNFAKFSLNEFESSLA